MGGALTKNFGKTYKILNVPGAGPDGSQASYINNEDDITFWWYDSNGQPQGALCTQCASKGDRTFRKFVYPKAVATLPNGINDKNTFVGSYQTELNGPSSGFEATFK